MSCKLNQLPPSPVSGRIGLCMQRTSGEPCSIGVEGSRTGASKGGRKNRRATGSLQDKARNSSPSYARNGSRAESSMTRL